MRKITTILLAGVATLAFTACGGGSSSGGGNNPPDENQNEPVESNVYIDEEVGVMWQDDVYAEITTKPWLEVSNYNACNDDATSGACEDTSGDTASTYCSDMVLDDYADWRLPTNDELSYLYTSEKYLSLHHIVMQDSNQGYDAQYKYWSSTPSTSWALGAYASNEIKTASDQAKNALYYVRCVRNL